jgi:putative peptide zinc metalloprotease protein
MLCRVCRIHVRRDFPYCLACGALRKGAKVEQFTAPQLRWGEPPTVVSLTRPEISVGRDADNDVVLDDPSVSRWHARIVRGADGFRVLDLGSFNGTAVRAPDGAERPATADDPPLSDAATVFFGDVETTFTQPRSVEVGGRTQLRGTEHTVLRAADARPEEAPAATEPLSARPERRSGWALKQVPGSGDPRWVLRNTRTGTYLSLNEREVFVWKRLDGEHTIRDLLFAYFHEFGQLALPRIEAAVRSFAAAGLVRGLPDAQPELTGWQKFGKALLRNLIRVQLSIHGLDPLMERAYRSFGWRLFTPAAVLALWALIIAGGYGFWLATQHQQLFDLAGAGPVGGAVVFIGYIVATAVHEAAHALAVKSYGRRVNRGGFMVMLGCPFAFVDTSDMWFGSPYSRIVVALSGPMTTAGIAGAAGLAAAFLPHPQVAGICFTLAYGLYANTLFNLIPLMPQDGYQALADALRTPRLREEAKQYLLRDLWRDLAAGRRPGPKQLGLLAFAATSMLCLYAMVGLAVLLWDSRLGDLLRGHVDQPWRTMTVVAVIGLLLFPIYFPLLRKVGAAANRRRTAAQALPQETATSG